MKPIASMIAVVALAVPMVMQMLWERAMPCSTPIQSSGVIRPVPAVAGLVLPARHGGSSCRSSAGAARAARTSRKALTRGRFCRPGGMSAVTGTRSGR